MPLFVRTRSGSNYWFNTELKQSEARKDEFRWAGWLMGQCFANRAMLCIPLPELLFVKLLKGSSFQVLPGISGMAQPQTGVLLMLSMLCTCRRPAYRCHTNIREQRTRTKVKNTDHSMACPGLHVGVS